jgi:outer membrane protein assembly factor BamB
MADYARWTSVALGRYNEFRWSPVGCGSLEIVKPMLKTRMLSVGFAAAVLASSALAQLNGPAPLAWRWVQSTSVSPGGSPLVNGNVVYVAVGQRVYALDKDSGNQKWKFPAVEPIEGFFRTSPIMVGGLVIVAADNKNIYALDPATGEKKWQFVAPVPIIGQPVALGDRMVGFAMFDNSLQTIDVATGTAGFTGGPVKLFDGIVGKIASYQTNFLVMNQANDLVSIDGVTGKIAWKRNFSGFSPDSQPIVYGDTIYVASNSFVVALNTAGGFRWNKDAGDFISFSPAVSPDGVAVATRDGKVVVFDVNNGRRLTHQEIDPVTKKTVTADSIDLGSFPQSSPSAVGHQFVFPTTSGTLTMFDPRSGALLWNYTIKPLVKGQAAADSTTTNPGGGVGGGGRGGGGRGSGGGGQLGGGSSNTTTIVPTFIPAAGPAVLAGDTLLVLSRDGSLLAFDKSTGVDLTPPVASMTFPNPGDEVTSLDLEVHMQLDDEASGLRTDSVTVSVDGKNLDYKLARDGSVVIRFNLSGKNGMLADGRHTFTIKATDWLGNSAETSYALTIDNNLKKVAPPSSTTGGRPNPGGNGNGTGGGGNGAG